MGKPTICIGEADRRLCFRYMDSTIPLLLKSEISSFWLFSVFVQVGLCRACSETTLLVFPRGGSIVVSFKQTHVYGDEGRTEAEQSNRDKHYVGSISGGPKDTGGIPDFDKKPVTVWAKFREKRVSTATVTQIEKKMISWSGNMGF